jgi:hypothetical protein
MTSESAPSEFGSATNDYRWLLDRGYPEQGSLMLVGDRYRLSRQERSRLYRSVSPTDVARRRSARVVAPSALSPNDVLGVDAHNVILTVANYLRGVPVFNTDDGVIRDIGGVHGRLHDQQLIARAIDVVGTAIQSLTIDHGVACFDEPLSHSRDHSHRLRTHLPSGWTVRLDRSADAALAELAPTVVVSSDSVVIDQHSGTVCDLARWVLEQKFGVTFS